jgi:hypothetical protein
VLVPRSSGTPVATWAWPTWVVSRRHVLEVVFILLEFQSPSRIIFIGSHSLPPLSGSPYRSFTIATKLFCGPWDAKECVALGYCDVVHQVVPKVFLLQCNMMLQFVFLPRLFWLQSVLLRCTWGVAKGAIATFLFRCKL